MAEARQNVTVQISKELIRKARIVAAQRGTSISGLLATELERIVGEHEAYEVARRSCSSKRDFHLGGKRVNRDELHER